MYRASLKGVPAAQPAHRQPFGQSQKIQAQSTLATWDKPFTEALLLYANKLAQNPLEYISVSRRSDRMRSHKFL